MDDGSQLHGQGTGLDRRTLLRRSAMVGGAAVWATPVVQSLARPAFAAGSPVCTELYRFKYEVAQNGQGQFDNGIPAPGSTAAQCLPDGYAEAPAPPSSDGSIPGHTGKIMIVLSADGKSAEVSLPPGCVLLDGHAKAGGTAAEPGGQGNDTAQCDEDAEFVRTEPDGTKVYRLQLPGREISFVAGVICCS